MGETQDEPLQLIEFLRTEDDGTTIQLKRDTIDRVFQNIGGIPVSVIYVCGPSGQEKSFLLGYMIRCLEGLEEDEEDWMDLQDKKKPLKGFKLRNDAFQETPGIWVWSRPFIVKNEEGDDIAVLLLDTQGTNDEFTTDKEVSAIVGLSLLTSSVMIFNVFRSLQENILRALGTYLQYYCSALDKRQSNGAPFQKLNFLIRDWSNPGQFGYGEKGGKLFLEEKLKIKAGQLPEARHFREEIRKCFQELDCFLMPSIGEKALSPEFKGSIEELDPKFAKALEKFINGVISNESLTVKKILGNPVTASDLRSSLETFVEACNSDKVHATRAESAKKTKKNGSQEIVSDFEEKLADRIKAEFSRSKKQNQGKRDKMIAGAITDTVNAFQSQLKDDFPLETDYEFYEESRIKKCSAQAKTENLDEFKKKLSDESEDKLEVLVQSVEESFEKIVASLLNKNRANRAEAEKQMNMMVNELSLSHSSKLQIYFDSNNFNEDATALENSHKELMSYIVDLFEERNKPGEKGFHAKYLLKLQAALANNFATILRPKLEEEGRMTLAYLLQDEPIQLVEFIPNEAGATGTIQLKSDTIDRVFQNIGDLPISVISVCGPSGQGKSFLLGYMIRCLEGLEKDDGNWMNWQDKKKPLKRFKLRNNASQETPGIWVWSRPFIVKNDEGDDIAVLVLDTKGSNDEFTTNTDMSAIVGLSLLTSSVIIFNIFKTLQENVLRALGACIQYGSVRANQGRSSGTPFQKLTFLIRDWSNPGQFVYGEKGGKLFLEEKLKIKAGQLPEAQHVREEIRQCFQELDCFLMPSIGEKALSPEFKGSIEELDPKFAKALEKFINGVISIESLTVKKISGNPVTAMDLRSSLGTFVEACNSDMVPFAETSQKTKQGDSEVERAIKKYRDFLKKKLRENDCLQEEDLDGYLEENFDKGNVKRAEPMKMSKKTKKVVSQDCQETDSDFEEKIEDRAKAKCSRNKKQNQGAKPSMKMSKKTKKVASQDCQETDSDFEEKVEDRVKAKLPRNKKQSQKKRDKMIADAIADTVNAFQSQLKDDFPLETDYEFYEESRMKRRSTQATTEHLEDFKEKLSDESEDKLEVLVQSVEGDFKKIVASLLNKNRANRAEAEMKMNMIVNELASSHLSKLQNYVDSSKFDVDTTALENNHKKIMSSIVSSYEERNKPGNNDFHREYLSKLEADMANNFTNLSNQHAFKNRETTMEAEKSIKEFSNHYEVELKRALERNGVDEEHLNHIHARTKSSTLQKFHRKLPFPRGSPPSNELETKLMEQLQRLFEGFKHQVNENKKRSVESYQKAKEHALNFYKTEMNGIVELDDVISEKDLEKEHKRILKEALKEYEDFSKIGTVDNATKIKSDLKNNLIMMEWSRIQSNYNTKRTLAVSKAQNFLSSCEAEYNKLMKKEMKNAKSMDELLRGHQRATSGAIDKFKSICPLIKPTIVKGYEEELLETIKEIFGELQQVFELRMTGQETAAKEMLTKARQSYHDEMGKHCKNDFFMTPRQLEALHGHVKGTVFRKCERVMPLGEAQKLELEKVMDDLLENIYKKKNDMLLNSGDMGVAPAIGIDLGTTYCCVAVFISGKVHIIPNQDQGGNKTTPSYVAFNPDGSESYGLPAKENAYKNPENTIYDAKRIIGRKITDQELQSDMEFWPFVVQEDQGIPKVMVNGKLLHPEQISAKLLAQFRVMAENYLKLEPGTIKNAVITVPAYFNDGQRQATVDAGELAGYEKVLTILNEPTAAAMAYSLERFDTDPKKILIFDLGGGTFDVAVLDMKPKEITVLGVNGDTHLGGEDFDKKLMEFCAASFKTQTGHDLFAGKSSSVKPERDEARRRLRRLQTHCEKAKRDLASAKTTRITVDALANGLDLTVDLTRTKFEELNMPFFEKSIRLVEETLRDVGLKKDQIDDVVLVGGSSRIPKVQEMLKTFFNGKALNKSIDPDSAVAYGAAVQAALLNGEQAKDQIDFDLIKDVTPMSIGVEVYGGGFSVIVPRNTKIPVKAQERYRTAHNNQTSVQITIYQGEEAIAVHNKHLGDFYLNGIPPKDAEVENIDVEMVINAQGILHVSAVCSSTGSKTGVTVTESKQRMTRAHIKRLLAEATPA